jgi:DNA mismatch endonuclease (patch repair protein)
LPRVTATSMPDNLSPEDRRRNMQAIRSSDTKPELVVRRFLHSHGLRFRLHVSNLPGKPDIVLPRHRMVVFVNGCFWHSHSCGRAIVPSTRESYWAPKLQRTVRRDRENNAKLRATGWRVVRVWECETQNPATLAAIFKKLLRSRRRSQFGLHPVPKTPS